MTIKDLPYYKILKAADALLHEDGRICTFKMYEENNETESVSIEMSNGGWWLRNLPLNFEGNGIRIPKFGALYTPVKIVTLNVD